MSTTVDGNSGGTALTTTSVLTTQGQVLQVVNYQTGAVATGTTVLPFDDTIPQNTEGNEYMTLAITPRSATSVLFIQCEMVSAHTVNSGITLALFQDSTANALASVVGSNNGANAVITQSLNHYMTSGTTSATTFKVRSGSNSAGTTTFNGQLSGRIDGGVLASSITITEIVP